MFELASPVDTRVASVTEAADLWAREVMKNLDNRIGPKKRDQRKSLGALLATGRFAATLYTGGYFARMQQTIEDMDRSSGDGAFKDNRYQRWLDENKQTDQYNTRLRYVTYYNAIQRLMTLRADVMPWLSRREPMRASGVEHARTESAGKRKRTMTFTTKYQIGERVRTPYPKTPTILIAQIRIQTLPNVERPLIEYRPLNQKTGLRSCRWFHEGQLRSL